MSITKYDAIHKLVVVPLSDGVVNGIASCSAHVLVSAKREQ